MNNYGSLFWEISPSKKRKQIQKFILISGPILILLFVLGLITYFPRSTIHTIVSHGLSYFLSNIFYAAIGISGAILSFLLFNRLLPYRNSAYYLDNEGILVVRGNKKKHFLWSEFECFCPYRGYSRNTSLNKLDRMEDAGKYAYDASLQIQGRIFYLQKKRKNIFSKLYKVFVVVYSIPENSESVYNFISKYLMKKEMTNITDLGLVFYKFK